MEVLEGESLCGSLLWLEGQKSESNWLLLLPSFCRFTRISTNDWQLLYYGQTVKDKLSPPHCAGMLHVFVCVKGSTHKCKPGINLTNVAWSLSTFEADSKCQSVLHGVAFSTHLLSPKKAQGVGVCNDCSSILFFFSFFLLGKTLLTLLALPVMFPSCS